MSSQEILAKLLGLHSISQRFEHRGPPDGWRPPSWTPDQTDEAWKVVADSIQTHVPECPLRGLLRSKLDELRPYLGKIPGSNLQPEFLDALTVHCEDTHRRTCKSSAQQGYIVVSHGFMFTAYQTALVCAARAREDASTPTKYSIDADELALRFRKLLIAFVFDLPIPVIVSYHELTEIQREYAGFLTYWLEIFAVAHELGHLIYARLESRELPNISARVVRKLTEAPGFITPSSKDWLESWAEEFACDQIAYHLTMGLAITESEKSGRSAVMGALAGAGLFFYFDERREEWNKDVDSGEDSASHPPVRYRWGFIEAHFATNQGYLQIERANRQFLDALMAKMVHVHPKMDEDNST